MPAHNLQESAPATDGRKGRVYTVRQEPAQLATLERAAHALHERMKAERGVGYFEDGRYRWNAMSATELMRKLALRAAHELLAEGAGNTGAAAAKKGGRR